ncbi:MAG TPA: alpha/beta hydrolase [Xanthobacteraceae bacterium]|jgi:pimeloyl-ACP methyl ester carboxylesterase
MLRWSLIALFSLLAVVVLGLAGAIAFGTQAAPTPMPSMQTSIALLGREAADLPAARRFVARDGTTLAYRAYPAAPDRVAVLIHGSSGSSAAMHGFAKALQAAGITVYAPDVRGHGESGRKGDIDYIGQIEDDLVDLLAALGPSPAGAKKILVGHSSGGGFVLRFAGSQTGERFDGYLLLAPYLSIDSPTMRLNAGGWVAPYIPRIIGLSILSRMGIHWFEGLPVLAFGILPKDITPYRTAFYSYRLWVNFSPHRDWQGDIRNIRRPAMVLVGANDELFRADQYAPAFKALRPDIPVEVLPNLDHMGPVIAPEGRAATIKAFGALSAR